MNKESKDTRESRFHNAHPVLSGIIVTVIGGLILAGILAWDSIGSFLFPSDAYLNISDEEWRVSSYTTSYLGSDMKLSLNHGEASATLFQVEDKGTATFQITHDTTEKNTDGWLFMVVGEDKRIIQKAYVDERLNMTEVSVQLNPGAYRAWLQLLDYNMAGMEVIIHTGFKAE